MLFWKPLQLHKIRAARLQNETAPQEVFFFLFSEPILEEGMRRSTSQ